MENKVLEKPFPLLPLLKCLLAAYIMTALLLFLLAFLLYQCNLTEGMVSISISGIYVISTFAAGFLAGKRMRQRKFLYGMAMGAGYFIVLAMISLLINRSVGTMADSFLTTLVLCTAGGTMGGMVS